MKKILLALVFLPISILIDAQSISLGTDNEYCPNIEYEFTVTLPEPYYSISATQMTITKDPYSFNTAYTSFKFKAKFKDANVKQFVVIRYKSDGTGYYTPEYKRVKSLFYNNNQTCGNIQPKFTSNNNPATTFNAPLCQVSNFSITFSKIKWFTDFEPSAYCFGEIADYEYQLPAGWMIGSNTSTGSNWIQGTNSVTITSDLATGNGARIFIRPKNTCGTNLNNYQVPASIVVLRAAAALTISASPNTVACGSTSPVVFTIDNTSSLTGITGYMWDLGNNNNWTYNGSPAPSSIYTTTNTLTLSPVCGTSLVSPSASVILTNAGNTCNIPVPAPTLTVTAPSLSIQGTQSLCSGTENYLIVGAPCNSPAIWSIEPGTGIANLNLTNGVSTSLTKVSDGKIVLTAKVASCGTEYSATLPIQVGTYTSSDFTLTASSGSNGYLSWCPNTTYGFTLGGPASNYSWYYPTGWTPNYISGYVCAIRSPSTSYPPTGDVSCTFTEPCGTSISKTIFVAYSSSGCSPITEPAYTYWPNPVTYSISVSVSSANMGLITIRAIEIVNASNYMTVFSQNYGTGVTNTSVTTYYYQPGNYLLRVYDGTTWRTYQFVKM